MLKNSWKTTLILRLFIKLFFRSSLNVSLAFSFFSFVSFFLSKLQTHLLCCIAHYLALPILSYASNSQILYPCYNNILSFATQIIAKKMVYFAKETCQYPLPLSYQWSNDTCSHTAICIYCSFSELLLTLSVTWVDVNDTRSYNMYKNGKKWILIIKLTLSKPRLRLNKRQMQ